MGYIPKKRDKPRRTRPELFEHVSPKIPRSKARKPQVIVKKSGRVELRGKAMKDLRMAVFVRSRGKCERCQIEISWDTFHLMHKIPRRMGGGSRDDTLENTMAGCARCHLLEHNQL